MMKHTRLFDLRVTKWKVLISLVPFIFPLNQIFVELDLRYDFFPTNIDLLFDPPIYTISAVENTFARPLAPFLDKLGFWSSSGIAALPTGPLLPGSFIVAIFYAIVIYLLLSQVSLRQRQSLKK